MARRRTCATPSASVSQRTGARPRSAKLRQCNHERNAAPEIEIRTVGESTPHVLRDAYRPLPRHLPRQHRAWAAKKGPSFFAKLLEIQAVEVLWCGYAEGARDWLTTLRSACWCRSVCRQRRLPWRRQPVRSCIICAPASLVYEACSQTLAPTYRLPPQDWML